MIQEYNTNQTTTVMIKLEYLIIQEQEKEYTKNIKR